MLGFVVIAVAGVLALSAGLGMLQWKKLEKLAFRCGRCAREFQRPAHTRYPRKCPHCGARDWAA